MKFTIDVSTESKDENIRENCLAAVAGVLIKDGAYFGIGYPTEEPKVEEPKEEKTENENNESAKPEREPLNYARVGDIVVYYEHYKGKLNKGIMLINRFDYGNGTLNGESAPRCIYGKSHIQGTWYGNWAPGVSTYYKATPEEEQELFDHVPNNLKNEVEKLIGKKIFN